MNVDPKLTQQQAEHEMELYRKVFTAVRILDAKQVEGGRLEGKCPCFEFWGKQHPCDNCVSRRVLNDKGCKAKMEYTAENLFEVTARYVEVDGKPGVMELIRQMDKDVLMDPAESELLVSRITDYHEKLYRDALTGAYNRRYYEDKYHQSEITAGIAVMDIDDFKLINDVYGHYAGDLALETVVKVIRRALMDSDKVIRYGGDEFVLLLPGIGKNRFGKKLQQLRQQIHAATVPGYSRIQLSVSIGGVWVTNTPVDEALKRADTLMYQAKKHKNTIALEHGDDEHTEQANEGEKPKVLVVGSAQLNREIIDGILHNDFTVLEAENGEKALETLEREQDIALVLLDIHMSGMGGFDVMEAMRGRHILDDVPVVVVSDDNSSSTIRKAFDEGASDYITLPFDAKVVYQRVMNVLNLYAKQRRLSRLVVSQFYEREKNSRMLVNIFSQIVEQRNGESGAHVQHIHIITSRLLSRLAQKTDHYDLSHETRELICTASSLHDIGKIKIDDKILNKQGQLTPEEYAVMKTHTLIGAKMLNSLELYSDEPFVKLAYQICRWHHERYDGSGYPDGLAGENIPIAAQVVGLADAYDSLSSPKSYKKSYTRDEALNMIVSGACGAFNPLLLECLEEIKDELKVIEDTPETK